MHRSLWASYLIHPTEEDDPLAAGPTLRVAINSLLDERERRCMDDVTLIGPPDDNDGCKLTEAEGLFDITDEEKLVVLRATVSRDYWDMGCVRYPDPGPDEFGGYIVSDQGLWCGRARCQYYSTQHPAEWTVVGSGN